MEITGEITGIKYNVTLSKKLKIFDFNDFDINKAPSACQISDKGSTFAISKWVSPKRTRSYPYERVYNTLGYSKKITVIPIVKDEGAAGDRDFIQWDTISLMSLLDVFVIFGYYDDAKKAKLNKITSQKFNNDYVISKINEIKNYHSSALHWNLNEINGVGNLLDKVKTAYVQIEKMTGVPLHNKNGLDNFQNKIREEVDAFMKFSRQKAKEAQSREINTIQPKEVLSSITKAKITITNYLGGQYFFTVDEILVILNAIELKEGKHSKNAILPSRSDIMDGLVKMILYTNLPNISLNDNVYQTFPILKLTSPKIKGEICSLDDQESINDFFKNNTFKESQKQLVVNLFIEAKLNNFTVRIHTL